MHLWEVVRFFHVGDEAQQPALADEGAQDVQKRDMPGARVSERARRRRGWWASSDGVRTGTGSCYRTGRAAGHPTASVSYALALARSMSFACSRLLLLLIKAERWAGARSAPKTAPSAGVVASSFLRRFWSGSSCTRTSSK